MELLPGRRQPGAGYEALHPELEGLNPEDYPDIHKMAILADVAPCSREYNTYRLRVAKEAKGNTELQIEYEKILDRVRRTKESVMRMADRHFTRSFRPAQQQEPRACAGGKAAGFRAPLGPPRRSMRPFASGSRCGFQPLFSLGTIVVGHFVWWQRGGTGSP